MQPTRNAIGQVRQPVFVIDDYSMAEIIGYAMSALHRLR
jgi:hypothetical protein